MKKLLNLKIFPIFVFCAIMMFFCTKFFDSSFKASADWSSSIEAITEGDGSENNPYIIDSAQKLAYMAVQINAGTGNFSSAYYKQTTNIDISANTWAMINTFGGCYDGQGYTISGLNKGSEKDYGFINTITESGVIKNVGFININLSTDTNTENNIGTFAIYSYGTIQNCFTSGNSYCVNDDTGDRLYTGGIVAYMEGGLIENCYNALNITVQSQAGVSVWKNVGGIVGRINDGVIQNCYNIGNLSISNDMYWRMGGIVARAEGGNAYNCAVLRDSCKSNGSSRNSLTNASSDNTTLKGSNNSVVEASVLKSSSSAPLSSWEWNTNNVFPRTWGFVTDTTSSFYNSGYPQLRVFYENFTVNFYSEDGSELIQTKTTRYPNYSVDFSGVVAADKIGHTFNGEFTSQPNSNGTKYTNKLENIYLDTSLYATYDINFYKLVITSSNSSAGEVSTKDELVAYNSNITATVGEENVGYRFLEWRNLSDNSTLSTSKEFSFNMPANDYSIYAYFSQETYFVKAIINDVNLGKVNGLYDYYTVGQTVELTALPSPGYKLDRFYTDDGTVLSTTDTYQFTMERENVTIYVDFIKATYNLTVMAYPNDIAEMVGSGEYFMDDEIELKFDNVQSGYKFACWKVDELDKTPSDCAEQTFHFVMPAKDTTIYCYFLTENLNYVAFIGLDGEVYSDSVVEDGQTITPPAPKEIENYNFIGWYTAEENGQEITSFENVTESINAYAVYQRIFNCQLSLSAYIIDENDYNSNLNTAIFVSLKSPINNIYSFAINNYTTQSFKLDTEGNFVYTYALPTYYKARIYLNEQEITTNTFNINLYDENVELKFVIYNSNDFLMYQSTNYYQNADEQIYNIEANLTIDDEDVYQGVEAVVSDMQFESLSQESIPVSPYGYEIKDVLGATNWGGLYNFTNLNYLVEGGKFISEDLGSSVYKVSFANHYQSMYPFNEDWGTQSINTMIDLAKTPAYSKLFAMPKIKTFVLVAYEFVYCPWERVITNGYTLETMEIYYQQVREEFADLTEYLLSTYQDKIFILSNWEGDNAYGAYFDMCSTDEQRQLLTDSYTGYINARQDGIILGRTRVENSTSKVYGNFEVCHIGQDIPYVPNRWRLVDVSIPYTYCDLYSFSDWYSYLQDEDGNYTFPLATLLNTLYSAAQNNLCFTNPVKYPLNPDFEGKKNVMITEFGYNENTDAEFDEKIQYEIKTAIEWGVYKLTYWGIYSNVRLNTNTQRPTNEELQGLWLIRPDGTFTKAFWYMKSIISGTDFITNTPKIVFSVDEACSFTWESVKDKIIFYDDLSDLTKIKNLTQDRLSLYNIEPASDSYKYFEEFDKYFSTVDTTGIIQTQEDDLPTYFTYDMYSNRFGIFLYNYTSFDQYTYLDYTKLGDLIILEGKNKANEWERITNFKFEQNQAQNREDGATHWFQTYISATTKVGEYSELKITFANKGYHSWDPIITGVAFFEGGKV